MPRKPTSSAHKFSWEGDFFAAVKTRNQKKYLPLWENNLTLRQFFSGLRVSIGDKEHVISQADCIQNIRFIVKSQIVVIFDEMLKTNPQIEAYFLGKKAQFGADAELYQCNPAEQFDHFVFFIVRRKEWAKKIWETSHIELMEVFSNFAEKEQAKNIKLLFKKYVLCFHEDILEEFIEKIDKAFLLNEILNILNAMEFNDNYYGRQTEKNRHILIQAINGRLLKIEDKQVKSMLVDGGHENLLEGEDEPNAMQAPKASVTEETLCVYSKIKNNKEIQQTWDCDATFRLYFSGCILLKTTVADNTLYKIDLAECIQNFKLASIYSMQAIVVFMCDNNNELKDYLSGKEVILNGELHVNNDAEHLDWFLKLLKSRAYDVVSDVWTKEYAERIVATLSALTPAKQNEMLNDILATKLISSVKCFKKIIKMINDINFLDKMLDVLQSKKTEGYTEKVNAYYDRAIETVLSSRNVLMAKAPAAIQTASLAGSDMSSWQSQPTRAEVAQPGTISPQALTNAHRFGVGFQYVGLAEGMAYDHELDPELFNAAPSLS